MKWRETPCHWMSFFYQWLFDRRVSYIHVPFVSFQIYANNSKHTLNLISNILLPLITIDNDTRTFFRNIQYVFGVLSLLRHYVHHCFMFFFLFGFIDTCHWRVCLFGLHLFEFCLVLYLFFCKTYTTLSIVIIMCKLQFSLCD